MMKGQNFLGKHYFLNLKVKMTVKSSYHLSEFLHINRPLQLGKIRRCCCEKYKSKLYRSVQYEKKMLLNVTLLK